MTERRERIDGVAIGCPVQYGEGNCPFCGGGWPGTESPSEELIESAQTGALKPEKLACGTLQIQGRFLVNHFKNGKEQVTKA